MNDSLRREEQWSKENKDDLLRLINTILGNCKSYGLRSTCSAIADADRFLRADCEVYGPHVQSFMKTILDVIKLELQNQFFFQMSPSEHDKYNQESPFGR